MKQNSRLYPCNIYIYILVYYILNYIIIYIYYYIILYDMILYYIILYYYYIILYIYIIVHVICQSVLGVGSYNKTWV